MSFHRIALEDFKQQFATLTELSSVALGGRIVSVSDEFFAEAYHLLLVEPAPSMKGQFGPNGALYSGWESRRHNPTHDWQLGTSGSIWGFDIDTSNFNGNEAPQVSVQALYDLNLVEPAADDTRWVEILPKVNLGPDSRHLFKISASDCYNYVKINMYPDGGIARFRIYGEVTPVHPLDNSSFDLAHVFAGGRVMQVSDQHFGVGSNLVLPGRGKNMGDGWETKRSRMKGHCDWVVIQLGCPGELEQVEIDTNHFLGNYPESCEIHAFYDDQGLAWATANVDEHPSTLILPRTKLGPGRQHYFELDNVEGRTFTHIKVTIHPDGGLKRVRVIGRKAAPVYSVPVPDAAAQVTSLTSTASSSSTKPSTLSLRGRSLSPSQSQIMVIPVVPLTLEEYEPFGQVIQGYDRSSAPGSIKVTPANGGTADKFHKLSSVSSTYPPEANATTAISVYRCQPLQDIVDNITALRTLERHSHTTQAFIPMGQPSEEQAQGYLVVVAHNGENDKPDMKTIKAFLAATSQGISYNAGVWHQPMTVLGKSLDLACVETQIGDGSLTDCEIVDLDSSSTYVLKLLSST